LGLNGFPGLVPDYSPLAGFPNQVTLNLTALIPAFRLIPGTLGGVKGLVINLPFRS